MEREKEREAEEEEEDGERERIENGRGKKWWGKKSGDMAQNKKETDWLLQAISFILGFYSLKILF